MTFSPHLPRSTDHVWLWRATLCVRRENVLNMLIDDDYMIVWNTTGVCIVLISLSKQLTLAQLSYRRVNSLAHRHIRVANIDKLSLSLSLFSIVILFRELPSWCLSSCECDCCVVESVSSSYSMLGPNPKHSAKWVWFAILTPRPDISGLV